MAIPQISRKAAKELIDKAEEQLNALKVQGIRLSTTNELLQKTKQAFEAKNLSNTISNLNELGAKLVEIKKNSTEFSKLVLTCYYNITQAGSMGIDIEEHRDIINEANELFDTENFKEAIALAKDCNQKLIDAQFLYLSEQIKEIYDQLKELPRNIISSHGIQQRLNDADTALKGNEFLQAWTITKQLQEIQAELLNPYIEHYQGLAKDKIIEFQEEIDNAKNKEIDISDALEIFSDMVDRMKCATKISEFKEIIDYTTAGRHALERALRRKMRTETKSSEIREKLDSIMIEYEELKEYCALPDSIQNLLLDIKEKIDQGDIENASRNLEIYSKKIIKLKTLSEPKIELRIQTDKLKSDIWNRTTVDIYNKGLASARNINLQFSGPLEIRRIQIIEILNYNSSKTIELGLKPEGGGTLPVDVDIQYERSSDGKQYHEHYELWLDILPMSTIMGPEDEITTNGHNIIKNDELKKIKKETVQCLYCSSPISKTELIFNCTCGVIYHLDCITELDTCIKCGNQLKQQVKQT